MDGREFPHGWWMVVQLPVLNRIHLFWVYQVLTRAHIKAFQETPKSWNMKGVPSFVGLGLEDGHVPSLGLLL